MSGKTIKGTWNYSIYTHIIYQYFFDIRNIFVREFFVCYSNCDIYAEGSIILKSVGIVTTMLSIIQPLSSSRNELFSFRGFAYIGYVNYSFF